eukprot:c20001_g3_i1.p1 GENE.c20001_g3_i1~~c20001_g3_i1.p1  ORF type:complete len:401 (+),score=115.69 c20001_g3_i1:128-1204(+)
MNGGKSKKDKLAQELYDASLTNAEMKGTRRPPKDGLAGELYDAALVSETKLSVEKKPRRSSIANELYDAGLVSDAKMVVPSASGNESKPASRRRSIANDLYDAAVATDALAAFSEQAAGAKQDKIASAKQIHRNSVTGLSAELYDAAILDVAMQQFAATTSPRQQPQQDPEQIIEQAIQALEGQFSGIATAFHPHPTDPDVYTIGPLAMKIQVINGKPMVAVGQGFTAIDAFLSKRAGRVRQILEATTPGAGRRGSVMGGADNELTKNLAAKAVKAVDVEIPGIFKAFQAHSSQPGTFRIGTMEFTVKVEDGQAIETTSGVELEQWLQTKKMKVRRAIFSHEQTPRAQSAWDTVHTPR